VNFSSEQLKEFRAGLLDESNDPEWSPPKKRKPMPSRQAIAKHWLHADRRLAHGNPCDERCWACGNGPEPYAMNLTRCHCIPHSIGGDVSCQNLVLLCENCHAAAPSVADPTHMWIYIERGGGADDRWASYILFAVQLMYEMMSDLHANGISYRELGKMAGKILVAEVGLAPMYSASASNIPYLYERMSKITGWCDQ
jgi:hypothetical protein